VKRISQKSICLPDVKRISHDDKVKYSYTEMLLIGKAGKDVMTRLSLFGVLCIFLFVCSFLVSGEESVTGEQTPVLSGPGDQEVSDYLNGSINLVAGWNFVSVPRRLANDANTASIFTGLDSAGHSIWTYNQKDGGWNDLTADDKILPLEGYWVYSTTPFRVPLRFSDDPLQVPPVKDMTAGWNMFGFTGNTPASARDSLLSIRNTWTEVIGWDPAIQQFEITIVNGGSNEQADSRMLEPTRSYWVYVTESCSLASIGA
jgi:hypothetical protein